MGYPRLVGEQPCVTADFAALNQLADYFRDKQKAKVAELKQAGTRVAFADAIRQGPLPALAWGERSCQ
ncbi:hypothetical protein ACF08O_18190 [Streptomyces paradoxus]|uniref:hypothetical protein n=1 Tax=Streptomyces paradoxus TaxID=66375 RepID=UPI0036F7D091